MALIKAFASPFGTASPDAYWHIVSLSVSRLGRQVGWRIVAFHDQSAKVDGKPWLPGSERDYRVDGDAAGAMIDALDNGQGGTATASLYLATKSLLTPEELELPEVDRPAPFFADAEDA